MPKWVRAVGWTALFFVVYYLGMLGIAGLLVSGLLDRYLGTQVVVAVISWGAGVLAVMVGYLAARTSRLGLCVSAPAGVLAAGWRLLSIREPWADAAMTLVAAGIIALGFLLGGFVHHWLTWQGVHTRPVAAPTAER